MNYFDDFATNFVKYNMNERKVNTMKNIRFFNYGNYSSDNYGAHSLCFEIDNNRFWFSYNTLVAFRINGEFHIIKNYWGSTTGKHLNWINSNKAIREDQETFNNNLSKFNSFCLPFVS